jgi:hypothetical protein
MTPSAKRPWHMFYPLGGIILLSLAWSGYWLFASQKAQSLMAEHRQALKAKGTDIKCENETWGGFPFRFEFRCGGPSLQHTASDVKITLDTGNLLVVAQAYNPQHILFFVDGPSRFASNAGTTIEASHKTARISLNTRLNGEWELSSDVSEVAIRNFFNAASLKFFARTQNSQLDLATNFEGLAISNLDNRPFKIAKATSVAYTSASILETASPLQHVVDRKMPIKVVSLDLAEGAVNLHAEGNLVINTGRQIEGKLATQTNDIDGLLNIAAPIFEINAKDSYAIKSLLNLLGNDPSSSAKKADLIAKDGELYWGPFRLTKLEPLF